MSYTRNQILESVLFRRGIYKILNRTPEQVKSLRQSFKKGKLEEATALSILTTAGFTIIQEELWDKSPSKK